MPELRILSVVHFESSFIANVPFSQGNLRLSFIHYYTLRSRHIPLKARSYYPVGLCYMNIPFPGRQNIGAPRCFDLICFYGCPTDCTDCRIYGNALFQWNQQQHCPDLPHVELYPEKVIGRSTNKYGFKNEQIS